MYLEHLRICKLKEDPKSKQWRYARTLQMSYVVQHEVRMATIAYLKRALKNESVFSNRAKAYGKASFSCIGYFQGIHLVVKTP